MSLKSCEKVETNTYELKLTATAEEFEAAIAKAYAKTKGKFNVPGFRKGKAPRRFIEKLYGEGAFYDEALEIIYPELYEAAMEEAALAVVSSPYDLDVPTAGKEGLEIVFKVTVEPEVTVKKHKGLKAPKEKAVASDEEINSEIDRMLEQNSRISTVEGRACENGDTTVIDYEGFTDGKAFDGGKAEGHELEIGSGSFIPGFEEQIIGHNAGDEFDITVTFPTEYDASLAGKEAVFKIKLHELKKKEIPELSDEFVKEVNDKLNTVKELKEDVKSKILEHKEQEAQRQFENAVLDALCENTDGEIPDVMIERAIDDFVSDFEYRLKSQGMSLEMYMSYLGMDMKAFREQYRDNALNQVKLRLALKKIAELEGITVTEDEKAEEIKKYAEMYHMDEEAIKKAVPMADLEGDIIRRKSMDLVIDAATAEAPKKAPAKKAEKADTDADAAAEEKPKKKAAAKKTDSAADDAADKPKKAPAKKAPAKKAEDGADDAADKPKKAPAKKKAEKAE